MLEISVAYLQFLDGLCFLFLRQVDPDQGVVGRTKVRLQGDRLLQRGFGLFHKLLSQLHPRDLE